MKITNENYSIGKPGHGYNINTHDGSYTDGYVTTSFGYVSIYAQGSEKERHVTRLTFIKNGRAYSRSFNGRRFTVRGIVTKAIEFAREISQGEVNE